MVHTQATEHAHHNMACGYLATSFLTISSYATLLLFSMRNADSYTSPTLKVSELHQSSRCLTHEPMVCM
jgi:hypothetical protein